jgi:hypothetical protein
MWEPRRLTTLWAFMACYRVALPFFLIFNKWTDYVVHTTPSYFSKIHFNIIPHLRLGLPVGLYPSGFPIMPCPSHPPWLGHSNYKWTEMETQNEIQVNNLAEKIYSSIKVKGTRWRWVVNFTARPLYSQGKNPRYPLDRSLGGPRSWCERCGEEKNLLPQPPSQQSVAIPTELSRLHTHKYDPVKGAGTYML